MIGVGTEKEGNMLEVENKYRKVEPTISIERQTVVLLYLSSGSEWEIQMTLTVQDLEHHWGS
jgi:hypothetical protein